MVEKAENLNTHSYIWPLHLNDMYNLNKTIHKFCKSWLLRTLDEEEGIFKDDALYLAGLAPILPLSRQIYIFTYLVLRISIACYSNGIFHFFYEQVVKFVDLLLFQASVNSDNHTILKIHHPTRKSNPLMGLIFWGLISAPCRSPLPHPMINLPQNTFSIVAWNARGIVRPSFIENFNNIVHHQNLIVFIITETRTWPSNIAAILENNNFEPYVFTDSHGFSSGIVLIWDAQKVLFTPLERDRCTIHGCVKILNSRISFVILAIYYSIFFFLKGPLIRRRILSLHLTPLPLGW